ncbi:P-loop containing nucleoside triphosphate hydrolase protein [Dissophora ornata]|nr:P-loop containing nucleoside triphosphate hydrolase protein [Dissophora ornata]
MSRFQFRHKLPTPARQIQLRPYQQECIDTCLSTLAKGTRRQMLSLPVASGKTVIAAHLIPQIPPPLRGATKTLFLAHRDELWDQAYNRINSAGLGLKVTMDQGKLTPDMDADVIVASVQSLGGAGSKRLQKYNPKEFKCILVDEAHHAVTDTYLRIFGHFGVGAADSHIALVGLSATVKREDDIKLGSVFDVIPFHQSVESMIAEGWLCRLLVKTIRIDTGQSLQNFKMGLNDFQRKDLSQKINTPERNKIIVQGYIDNCANRMSTIAFATDIAHVEALTRAFQQHGLDARAVSSKTPNAERKQLVNDFRERKFPILVNCGILTEGTDIPTIDSILMARPTKSEILLQQMLGRGMRLYEGKKNCLVLDFADIVDGNYLGVQPTLLGLDPKQVLTGESHSWECKLFLKREANL